MPKSKLYMSVSTDDHASSLNGAITDSSPSSPTLFTRNKVYSPGPSGEHAVGVVAGQLPEEVYTNVLL